jgi:hypothetical protein
LGFPFRRRKKQVEGWALDVEDTFRPRLREKLGNNNKLWGLCLLAVVAGTVYYATLVARQFSPEPLAAISTRKAATGTYNDAAHMQLVEQMVRIAKKDRVDGFSMRFTPSHVEIEVPSDTSTDEVHFLSRFIAMAINRRFGGLPRIYVYTRRLDDTRVLTGVTAWSNREKKFLMMSPDQFEREYRVTPQ